MTRAHRRLTITTRLFMLVTLSASFIFAVPGWARAATSPAFVFRIGTLDHSAAEFALNPDQYARYPATFPNDIHYVVGTSTPSKDWSYVQPGVTDGWAGGHEHPFTIQYGLDAVPDTGLRLSVFYLDVQDTTPPTVQVASNGTPVDTVNLPPGSGRGVWGTGSKPYTLAVDVPASTLRQGDNTLTITNTQGSWTVYDAVELIATPPPGTPSDVSVEHVDATPLIVHQNGADRQMVDVSVTNSGAEGQVTFTASVGDQTETTSETVPPGSSIQRMPVPPAPGPGPSTLTIATGANGQPFSIPLAKQRDWRVDIVAGSHQDLGFTAPPPQVRTEHDSYLDQAVTLCENTATNPADARFRWTIEHAWTLDNYVKDRPAAQLNRLADCMRNGQIDLGATYDNHMYGLDSAEQMIQALYPGTRTLPEQLNVQPPATAINDDDNAVTSQDIQALHEAGVKKLMLGIDPARSPQLDNGPTLFWWQAPDGSKVLTFYGKHWYSEGFSVGLQQPVTDLPSIADGVSRVLSGLEASGYGPSVYPMMTFLDNSPPVSTLPDLVKAWNATYVSPHLAMSTASGFFSDLTQHDLAQAPTYQGDWSDWWSDGSGSTARETALTRQAQYRTTSAETLGALAALRTPNASRRSTLDNAYSQEELYDEHTWGSPVPSWDDPIWPYKQAHADQADTLSQQAMTSALGDLGGQVDNQSGWPDIAVFNSTSATQSGPVTATVPTGNLGGGTFALLENDQSVPYEITKQSAQDVTVRFIARGVPALGYQTFTVRPADGSAPAQASDPSLHASKSGLENRYYKVSIDPATGAISSVIDKTTGRELVDQNAPFQLNQYVYRPNCAGADKLGACLTSAAHQWSPSNPTITVTSNGPVAATVAIHYSGGPGGAITGVNGIDETIALYSDLPRIDLHNSLDKARVDTAEEGYYAFPFNVTNPDINYAVPGTSVRFLRDQIPGAALDWQAIRDYADISNQDAGVTFSAVDAPLVEFDHIRTQEFLNRPGRLDGTGGQPDLTSYQPQHGWLFSYIFNNLWYSNFRIAQAGQLTFDYSITAHGGGFDPVRANGFGSGVQTPLQAVPVSARQDGSYPPGQHAFVSVAPQNVVVQTIKRPYDGQAGLVVRLGEIAGQSTTATVQLPFQVGRATLDDLTEHPKTQLTVHGNTLQVPVTANGIATISVQPLLGLATALRYTTVPRGTSTRLTATVTNNTPRPISPVVSVTGSGGLTVNPPQVSAPELQPGASTALTFTVQAAAEAAPAPASLTISASAPGVDTESTQLDLSVVNPVDLAVTPNSLDLVAGHPVPVDVTVTNNLATKTTAQVALQTPAGWTVTPGSAAIDLDAGESKTTTVTLTPPASSFGDVPLTVSATGDWPTTSVQPSAAVSRPLVMVGSVDRSTSEFALSPNQFGSYLSQFPNDVNFTAGTDNPATTWSYIQPGTIDPWAGSRPHTFTFHFTLGSVPSVPASFTAWLLDTNPFVPTQLEIAANGNAPQSVQLPLGGGDGYHWGDGQPNGFAGIQPYTLNVPLPGNQLQAGENTLTIRTVGGGWLVYDAFGIREVPQ